MFRRNRKLETQPVVLKTSHNVASGLLQFFQGMGNMAPMAPGNITNPPGNPPVETGNYQFIQDQFFQGAGAAMTDIASVPPAYSDWGQFGVNAADASGQTGGGVDNGAVTELSEEADLYYDSATGQYYNIGA